MAKTLLLADDSVTVQRVIELTFAEEGMHVVAVGSGREAMARFEIDRPDIVLADVSMPDGDGYAVAEHVKALAGDEVPVVLMTGAFEQLDEDRAKSVGCDGVLAKPFEPQMAIALVRDLLEREPGTRSVAEPIATPDADSSAAFAPAVDGSAVVAGGAGSLDDYFDRLDEALASAGYTPSEPAIRGAEGGAPSTATSVEAASGAERPASLAQAFSALLADELGEAPLPDTWKTAPAPRLEVDDALVDRIANRVAERLADTAIREAVERRVLDVAERLIREEIDRIKTGV